MLSNLIYFILVQYLAYNNLILCQQGATIVDRAVIITPAENYQLPPEAHKQLSVRNIFYIL